MSSHKKHHKPSHEGLCEYKIIGSDDIKKKDHDAVDEYLNALGSKGWELVVMDIKKNGTHGVSFLGIMKRKTHRSKH